MMKEAWIGELTVGDHVDALMVSEGNKNDAWVQGKITKIEEGEEND